MVKFLIPIATAASALAIAAPASAQYYGGGYGYNNYGYDNGYNNYGYGYQDGRAGYQSRQLIALNQRRMARLQYQIRSLEAQGRIGPGEAARLERTAAQFRRELQVIARDGMTGQEGAIFDARVGQLGREIQAYARGYRNGNGYGYGGDDDDDGYGGY